jgi:hypothetical protein
MAEFVNGDWTDSLAVRDIGARDLIDLAIRSNMTTGNSMLGDDEVLALACAAALSIVRCGITCGFDVQVRGTSSELGNAAKSGKFSHCFHVFLCL